MQGYMMGPTGGHYTNQLARAPRGGMGGSSGGMRPYYQRQQSRMPMGGGGQHQGIRNQVSKSGANNKNTPEKWKTPKSLKI